MNNLICDSGASFFVILFAGVILILSLFYWVKSLIVKGINGVNFNNADVIYSENLLEDLEIMKKDDVFRLYATKINNGLYVITTSIIGEVYKQGALLSYFGEKATTLKTTTEKLSNFANRVPNLDVKSIATQNINEKVRIKKKIKEGI